MALCSPSSTPAGARTELKKLLQARQVRASIADDIIRRVFSATPAAPTPVSELPSTLDEGTSSGGRSGAVTPANDQVPVVYVSCEGLITIGLADVDVNRLQVLVILKGNLPRCYPTFRSVTSCQSLGETADLVSRVEKRNIIGIQESNQ